MVAAVANQRVTWQLRLPRRMVGGLLVAAGGALAGLLVAGGLLNIDGTANAVHLDTGQDLIGATALIVGGALATVGVAAGLHQARRPLVAVTAEAVSVFGRRMVTVPLAAVAGVVLVATAPGSRYRAPCLVTTTGAAVALRAGRSRYDRGAPDRIDPRSVAPTVSGPRALRIARAVQAHLPVTAGAAGPAPAPRPPIPGTAVGPVAVLPTPAVARQRCRRVGGVPVRTVGAMVTTAVVGAAVGLAGAQGGSGHPFDVGQWLVAMGAVLGSLAAVVVSVVVSTVGEVAVGRDWIATRRRGHRRWKVLHRSGIVGVTARRRQAGLRLGDATGHALVLPLESLTPAVVGALGPVLADHRLVAPSVAAIVSGGADGGVRDRAWPDFAATDRPGSVPLYPGADPPSGAGAPPAGIVAPYGAVHPSAPGAGGGADVWPDPAGARPGHRFPGPGPGYPPRSTRWWPAGPRLRSTSDLVGAGNGRPPRWRAVVSAVSVVVFVAAEGVRLGVATGGAAWWVTALVVGALTAGVLVLGAVQLRRRRMRAGPVVPGAVPGAAPGGMPGRRRAEMPGGPSGRRSARSALGRSAALGACVVLAVGSAFGGRRLAEASSGGAPPIPGAPGYTTFTGPEGKPMAVGRPWGSVCRPVVFVVTRSVPDAVYDQIVAVVGQARSDGVDVTVADRNDDWVPGALYPSGLTDADVAFVPIQADATSSPTLPSGHREHIGFGYDARPAADGTHEVLTSLEGTLYLRDLDGSAAADRRATRQLVAFSQGVGSSGAVGSGIAPGNTRDGFSPGDLAAMRTMSGCREPEAT